MVEPIASICIPTYNRLEYLKRALCSALNQTYQNIEVIIFNNASNDGTCEYIKSMQLQYPQIKLINNTSNIGLVKNIQQIPNYVNGLYLNILSDDDYLMPEFIQIAVDDLEKNAAVLWCSESVIVDGKNQLVKHNRKRNTNSVLIYGNVFAREILSAKKNNFVWCSYVYNVEILRAVGGFNDSILMDLITGCAVASQGMVFYNQNILSAYTWANQNDTHLYALSDFHDAFYFGLTSIKDKLINIKISACARHPIKQICNLCHRTSWPDIFNSLLLAQQRYGLKVYFFFLCSLPRILLFKYLSRKKLNNLIRLKHALLKNKNR